MMKSGVRVFLVVHVEKEKNLRNSVKQVRVKAPANAWDRRRRHSEAGGREKPKERESLGERNAAVEKRDPAENHANIEKAERLAEGGALVVVGAYWVAVGGKAVAGASAAKSAAASCWARNSVKQVRGEAPANATTLASRAIRKESDGRLREKALKRERPEAGNAAAEKRVRAKELKIVTTEKREGASAIAARVR
jgi:hypothetical protein